MLSKVSHIKRYEHCHFLQCDFHPHLPLEVTDLLLVGRFSVFVWMSRYIIFPLPNVAYMPYA